MNMNKIVMIACLFGTFSAYAMENHVNQLLNAITTNDLAQAEKHLAMQPAAANMKSGDWCFTALMEATEEKKSAMCKLLLNYGADLSIASCSDATALDMAASQCPKSLCKLLITHATFDRMRPSKEKREQSQEIVFTFLLALKRVCPILPKDVQYLILKATEECAKHVAHCPFGIHRNNPEAFHSMPFEVIRPLITNNIIKKDAVIKKTKEHTIERLKPLMVDARLNAKSKEIKQLLDTSKIEENIGTELEARIEQQLNF